MFNSHSHKWITDMSLENLKLIQRCNKLIYKRLDKIEEAIGLSPLPIEEVLALFTDDDYVDYEK